MEIKIFKCKLCGFEGTRRNVRKHIRENHVWKDGGLDLSDKLESRIFS